MLTFLSNLFAPPRDLILLVVMVWVGTTLAERRAPKHGIAAEPFSNLMGYGIGAFLLLGGSQAVSLNFSASSPLRIVQVNIDLFEVWWGLAASLLVAIYLIQRYVLPLWNTLDALTPFFASVAVGLALSNLASGNAYGMETTVPWAIDQWGALRHPAQLYGLVASLLILGWSLLSKADSPPGILFLHFTALTAATTLFLEAFRGDSVLILNKFRLAQLIAWLVLALALFTGETIQKGQELAKRG